MPSEIEGLEKYIKDTLGVEISRLSNFVQELSSSVRTIEITTTTRVAEIQKDLGDLYDRIQRNETAIKSLGDSQKVRWSDLQRQQAKEREEQAEEERIRAEKEKKQGIENEKNKQVRIILWLIFVQVLGLVIGLVWALIQNGGFKGLFS